MTSKEHCDKKWCGPACTFLNLILGGLAGLGFWEVFATVISSWLIGDTLKSAALIHTFYSQRLGIELTPITTVAVFYARNVLLFPVLYYALTRYVKSFGMPANGFIWGTITYLIAFGVVAPLAYLPPFMLNAPAFSFLNLVCYAVNGFVTAYVFEKLEKSRCA